MWGKLSEGGEWELPEQMAALREGNKTRNTFDTMSYTLCGWEQF